MNNDQATLSAASWTDLPVKPVAYSINCTAATKNAIGFTDNRVASAQVSVANGGNVNFGLGKDSATQNNIGNYAIINGVNSTADGVAVDGIYTNNSGATWTAMPSLAYFQAGDPAARYSYAAKGSTVPVAARVFAGNFEVHGHIVDTTGLDLSNEINLDGLATLEVSYL